MWKKAVAEFMGTLFLVLIGTGAVVFEVGMVGVALAFGFIFIAMAYSIGTISGAHVNPAVCQRPYEFHGIHGVCDCPVSRCSGRFSHLAVYPYPDGIGCH